MESRHPKSKYIVMDETSYGREYGNGIVKDFEKVNLNGKKLQAEFDQFDTLLKKELGKKLSSDWNSETDFRSIGRVARDISSLRRDLQ